MTTNSKTSSLTLIIITAVLLFIIAAIWKSTQSDNSEEVYVQPIENTKPVKKNNRKAIEDKYNITSDASIIKETDTREKLGQTLNKHLMLNTPEKVMEYIEYYQEKGDEDKANEYIEFLLMKFPDFELE